MPTENPQTSREIFDRILKILERQKELMKLFRETNNRDYLQQFEALSEEFQRLRKSLKEDSA